MSITSTMPPASHDRGNPNSNECPNWINRTREQELTIVQTDSFAQVEPLMRATKLANDPIPGFLPYRRSKISIAKMEIASLHPCALYVLNSHLDLVRDLRHTFLTLHGIDILHLTEDITRITYHYRDHEDCIIAPQ